MGKRLRAHMGTQNSLGAIFPQIFIRLGGRNLRRWAGFWESGCARKRERAG